MAALNKFTMTPLLKKKNHANEAEEMSLIAIKRRMEVIKKFPGDERTAKTLEKYPSYKLKEKCITDIAIFFGYSSKENMVNKCRLRFCNFIEGKSLCCETGCVCLMEFSKVMNQLEAVSSPKELSTVIKLMNDGSVKLVKDRNQPHKLCAGTK
ncbi:uncharacterized protein LOC143460352 [Clavelina lepadiformis]|uniref:Uncharacterized protein n=1 Tax=Clavelina lepadiformis TaxID=159417 RepID=A0ABP0FNQ4_CLALP